MPDRFGSTDYDGTIRPRRAENVLGRSATKPAAVKVSQSTFTVEMSDRPELTPIDITPRYGGASS